MGRVLSLPPYALAAARARLERERAGLKHFLMTVESVLEEHEVFDIEPWLHGSRNASPSTTRASRGMPERSPAPTSTPPR
jgi:hypothetical protein